jgi:FKBP-type peptidyl-prolyl cis-trans isomerase FkpA
MRIHFLFLIMCLALPGCQRKSGNENGTRKATPTNAPADGKRITLPSGVQYEDLVVGAGPEVQAGQSVTCHATGWLTDGKKFWSSHDGANQPADFTLRNPGGVIQGWVDGVPGMKPGGKRKLWIPSKHAYGAQGRPPRIPPNSDLVFEIELIAIR